MVRENQIIVDGDNEDYICLSCDKRTFPSAAGLLQHCRNNGLHRGEWCERCQWLFVSPSAWTAHVRSSDLHAVCTFCGIDAADREALSTHQSTEHKYCADCEEHFVDKQKHRVAGHNRCRECGEEFTDINDLAIVGQRRNNAPKPQVASNLTIAPATHLPRSKECYGCLKKYSADSAVFDHLEYDVCASGVTGAMIDQWVFECYQHRAYTNDWDDEYRYRCPVCDNHFEYISALLRHAESPACEAGQEFCLKKMKAYVERKVSEYEESN